jgi:hypothetical protein
VTGLELEFHHRDTRGEIAQQLEGTPACALLAAERCLDIASLLYGEFCHASTGNTNGPYADPLIRHVSSISVVLLIALWLMQAPLESIWKNIANLNGSFNTSTSRATADGLGLGGNLKGRRTRMRPNWQLPGLGHAFRGTGIMAYVVRHLEDEGCAVSHRSIREVLRA